MREKNARNRFKKVKLNAIDSYRLLQDKRDNIV